jgi:hypothetical protein
VGRLGERAQRVGVEKSVEPVEFGFEGERGDAAEYEAADEQSQPEADTAEVLRVGHCFFIIADAQASGPERLLQNRLTDARSH